MTFVGKVLVVVQVALSLCFMALAGAVYTVQTNWKAESEKLQETLANRAREYDDLTQQFTTFRADQNLALNDAVAERDTLKAEAANLQGRLTSAENELRAAQAETKSLTTQVQLAKDDAQARIEQYRVQYDVNQQLRDQIENYRKSLQDSKDAAFQLRKDLEKSQATIAALQNELTEAQLKFASIGIDPDTVQPLADGNAPPPNVNGLVLVTRKSAHDNIEYVEISLGKDDGLREGNQLLVYRLDNGGKYLGKIRLMKVNADNAVGTVVEKAKNGIIQRGDHVATKL